MLLDEGALVREAAGMKLTKSLGDLKIPPTVQAILASRIDRLPAAQKELLQSLAIVGKEFSLRLVQAVSGQSDDRLDQLLSDLQLAEFIYEQPSSSDVVFTFKHALIRDVAYSSVLAERRRLLHHKVGTAIESIFAHEIDGHLYELAQHYGHSGDRQKAFEFAARAGERAARVSSGMEAINQIEAALQLLYTLPDLPDRNFRELGLQLLLGSVLASVETPADPTYQRPYRRAVELCAEIQNDMRIFPAMTGLWLSCIVGGQISDAEKLAHDLLKIAEGNGGLAMLASAHANLGVVSISKGELTLARERLEKSLAECDLKQCELVYFSADSRPYSLTFLGWVLWMLGFPGQSAARCAQALTELTQLVNPLTSALSRNFLCNLGWLLDDRPLTARLAHEILASAEQHGLRNFFDIGAFLQAWASSDVNSASGLSDMKAVHKRNLSWELVGRGCGTAYRCFKRCWLLTMPKVKS